MKDETPPALKALEAPRRKEHKLIHGSECCYGNSGCNFQEGYDWYQCSCDQWKDAFKSELAAVTAHQLHASSVLGASESKTVIGSDFYNGIEWLAVWLVDHEEGETITEELVRQWAVEAWRGRPETPFSRNVRPFDYATPEARAIKDKLNAGLTSQEAICRIDLSSQGVIYKGELWFCLARNGYAKRGAWTPDKGRPSLHRVIWEEVNGLLPAKHCVYFKDGSKNNFDPGNLGMMSMGQNLRRNQATALFRKSRERTALLLQRSPKGGGKKKHGHISTIQALKAA